MTGIEDSVPPYEPAEDTLAFVGKLGLSAIPVVGGMAAEAIAHALDTRQAKRQHEFNVLVAGALATAAERLESSVTIIDIVDSDEFLAAVTRAQRAAAETSSDSKRRRLAAAAVNSGSWAPFAQGDREQFTRLVESLDDFHVWLLHYFADPRAWLHKHDLLEEALNHTAAGISAPLAAALGYPVDWHEPFLQAAGDLDRAGLAAIPMGEFVVGEETLDMRTLEKGLNFLHFLSEPASAEVEPPSTIRAS